MGAAGAALSPRFGVLRYDHPGHGSSRDDPPARSAEALARGVLGTARRARAAERVSFCGLSLGGAVGMWLAMHAPERIDRLVLACTSARFGTRENWLARAATVRAEGVEASRTRSPGCGSRRGRTASSAPLVAAYREMMISADSPRVRGMLRGARRLGARTGWRRSRAHVVLAVARIRPRRPPRSGDRGRIPGRGSSILEGAGDLANVEEPAAFNRLLLDHLTDTASVEVA